MVLWTMLVHGFGSILGRFAAVLVFFRVDEGNDDKSSFRSTELNVNTYY